ncbi:carbohydrate-binding module 48 [Leptospira hartskeerlii]|uniref:Carbohydrate-binding module 48 n=2 Tax=Leptospira TaxID=171 RepID=A0A4R9J2S5_9LEPT|nr:MULTISPECIES: carbohydrate-binding module 48 [Leptospira]PJZ25139.1 carbohydrate-binding module 48 [Leptospira hartskeerlii]PJZ33531.1 carbohydrate-binding module 48 [Leptospira hartskeerlii]TGL29748.1 carbohydrate-binding module 48 [Leptospira koniambonensis]
MVHKAKAVALLTLILTFALAAEEAEDWIGAFRSVDYEEGEEALPEEKIYYFWQLENLRKAVPPRFIRFVDTFSALKTGKLLNRGVLFSYEGLANDEVSVCGEFSHWQCVSLQKNDKGIFYGVVDIHGDQLYEAKPAYEYKFKVDGIFTHDPENPDTVEDGEGSLVSRIAFREGGPNKQTSTRVLEDSPYEEKEFRTVEFRIYQPQAESVSLIGDFNHWDPESDFLIKERNGTFRVVKKLKPGEYQYNFLVDGKIVVDTYNPLTVLREDTGEISSALLVPTRTGVLERKKIDP